MSLQSGLQQYERPEKGPNYLEVLDLRMSGSVEIPLRESDEVIEIPFSELPEGEEVTPGDCLLDVTSCRC